MMSDVWFWITLAGVWVVVAAIALGVAAEIYEETITELFAWEEILAWSLLLWPVAVPFWLAVGLVVGLCYGLTKLGRLPVSAVRWLVGTIVDWRAQRRIELPEARVARAGRVIPVIKDIIEKRAGRATITNCVAGGDIVAVATAEPDHKEAP